MIIIVLDNMHNMARDELTFIMRIDRRLDKIPVHLFHSQVECYRISLVSSTSSTPITSITLGEPARAMTDAHTARPSGTPAGRALLGSV